jgi:hypothetical protein
MPVLPMLDVAIGIIVVFILVSLICSAVREALEGLTKTRAAYLEHGLRELLHDKGAVGLVASFYTHPLIYSLYSGNYKPKAQTSRMWLARGRDLPSYIPSKNFALALMDIAARGLHTDVPSSAETAPVVSLDAIRKNVGNLQNAPVQRLLLGAIDAAQGDLNKLQKNLETWFDTGMDRVSGWYKRSTQWILFGIGLFVAVSLNVNTITIADYLSRNPAARDAMVETATKLQEQHAKDPNAQQAKAKETLESLNLPIGWKTWPPSNAQAWLVTILGLLLTAFAATFGAPFWFDVLNKVMVIRSTVKPHEKSPEESSEDRQRGNEQPTVVVQTGAGAGDAAAPPPLPPPQPEPVAGGDLESDVDACDIDVDPDQGTPDDELPAAMGGVA